MTTEEMEFLNTVRTEVHNLGASFNELLAAIGPLVAVIQRQEVKIDSNAAAVELMLREQAGLSSKADKIAGAVEEVFQGLDDSSKDIGRALRNNGDNQMIDNKNILSIGSTVNGIDKKLDVSVEKLYSRLGAVIATLDNQWANR